VNKKILVTGATGFVGRQIIYSLANSEVFLFPVVRQGKENLVNNLPNVERVISTPNLFAEDAVWWASQCQDIDTIVHAAWYVEPGKYLQSSKNLDCLMGSLNLAKGAAKARVRRFVGIGTCFEYELSSVDVLSVDTTLKPLTPYAGAKASLFVALSQWLPSQAIEFAWCRLFYLYGEGEDERRLVPYLRSKLQNDEVAELSSGKQIRDFLNVTDVGSIISEVALGSKEGPINVCSGVPITVRQLAEKIADEYDRRDLLKFGMRKDNLFDPPCVVGLPNWN
jgi:nucleoside-diphosphate-sugar epimerase